VERADGCSRAALRSCEAMMQINVRAGWSLTDSFASEPVNQYEIGEQPVEEENARWKAHSK